VYPKVLLKAAMKALTLEYPLSSAASRALAAHAEAPSGFVAEPPLQSPPGQNMPLREFIYAFNIQWLRRSRPSPPLSSNPIIHVSGANLEWRPTRSTVRNISSRNSG
jgi:hypothetical protein